MQRKQEENKGVYADTQHTFLVIMEKSGICGILKKLVAPVGEKWQRAFPVLVITAIMGVLHLPFLSNFFIMGWADQGDGLLYQWNFWWFNKALIELHQSPYSCDYIFSPIGLNLSFHDFTPLYGLISIPFQYLFSLGTTYNVLVELIFFFTALAAYHLCYELTGNRRASILGSIIYGFSPYVNGYSSQISVLSVQWLPLALLFWIRAQDREKFRYPMLCGLFIAASFYCSFNHTIFILLALLLYSCYHLLASRSSERLKRFIFKLAILCVTVLTLTFPVLIIIFNEIRRFGFYATCLPVAAEGGSVDPFLMIIPSFKHPFWGGLMREFLNYFNVAPQWNVTYIGFPVILLSVLLIVKSDLRKKGLPWLLLGALAFVLSLGPTLLVAGKRPFGSLLEGHAVHLPFYYLMNLPGFSALREPKRLFVIVYLTAAVLSSISFSWFVNRYFSCPSKSVLKHVMLIVVHWLCIIFILIDYLPLPQPVRFLEISSLYNWLSKRTGSAAVLYIPIVHLQDAQRRIDHYYQRQILFLQTCHERVTTSGYVSRRPPDDKTLLPTPYFMKKIAELQAGQTKEKIDYRRIDRELPFAMSLLGADTIVLDKAKLTTKSGRLTNHFLQQIIPSNTIKQDRNLYIWEIPSYLRHPTKYIIDLLQLEGTDPIVPSDQIIHFKEGSSAITAKNQLYLSLPAIWKDKLIIELGFDFIPYTIDFSLYLDDEIVCMNTMEPGFTIARLYAQLPHKKSRIPHRLKLQFDVNHKSPIFQKTKGEFTIKQPEILTYSAGMDAGNISWTKINDRIYVPGSRGYCLVAWSKEIFPNGKQEIFDTHGNTKENDRLSRWVNDLPENTIVVGSILDDATSQLNDIAVDALKTLGCQADMRGKFRWSHTFIGKKGIDPGQAIESYSPGVSSVSLHEPIVPLKTIKLTCESK